MSLFDDWYKTVKGHGGDLYGAPTAREAWIAAMTAAAKICRQSADEISEQCAEAIEAERDAK